MNDLARLISSWQARVDRVLQDSLLLVDGAPDRLKQAMGYSALSGGKRMRPLLVYAAGRALGMEERALDGIAAAIEIIHAYSLIHDDLPAMDDDDLRRGRPTCHIAYDEATAILAGDALQALAFEVLARDPELSARPRQQGLIIGHIARACGGKGMAGGQAIDLAAVGRQLSVEELEQMHGLKTGALISASATAPAILSDADEDTVRRLTRYGEWVGLSFQIHDDLLDVMGNTSTMGKSAGKDAEQDKPTFPGTLGITASRRRAEQLRDMAVAEIGQFPGNVDGLEWLAGYAVDRDS